MTTVFVLDSRQSNISLGRALLSDSSVHCTVLDIDALYSSCADSIMKGFDEDRLKSVEIRMPSPESVIESDLSVTLSAESGLIIIDSLNSLNHLLSSGSSRSRGRKLAFAMAMLSAYSRENGKAVVLSMYRRERVDLGHRGSSISELADLTVSVEQTDTGLRMTCERGKAWPGGAFSLRIT